MINETYLRTKSSVTYSRSGTAALAASGAINALDTFDLNLDHGSPCLRENIQNLNTKDIFVCSVSEIFLSLTFQLVQARLRRNPSSNPAYNGSGMAPSLCAAWNLPVCKSWRSPRRRMETPNRDARIIVPL